MAVPYSDERNVEQMTDRYMLVRVSDDPKPSRVTNMARVRFALHKAAIALDIDQGNLIFSPEPNPFTGQGVEEYEALDRIYKEGMAYAKNLGKVRLSEREKFVAESADLPDDWRERVFR